MRTIKLTIKLNARVYIGIEFAYEFKLCLKIS